MQDLVRTERTAEPAEPAEPAESGELVEPAEAGHSQDAENRGPSKLYQYQYGNSWEFNGFIHSAHDCYQLIHVHSDSYFFQWISYDFTLGRKDVTSHCRLGQVLVEAMAFQCSSAP